MNANERLDETFHALSDPTRRAILARLARGQATVSELAKPFEITMPGISKHLKVLERAGLITRGRTAQWGPCQLRPAPLEEARDWLDAHRRFWSQSFDRLADLLVEQERAGKERGRNATRKRRRP